jgi:hypothetical protein
MRRASLFRDHAIFTHAVVFLARHPRIARRMLARLAAEPSLFSRLLSVGHGERAMRSIGVMDLCKLAIGRAPPRRAEVHA